MTSPAQSSAASCERLTLLAHSSCVHFILTPNVRRSIAQSLSLSHEFLRSANPKLGSTSDYDELLLSLKNTRQECKSVRTWTRFFVSNRVPCVRIKRPFSHTFSGTSTCNFFLILTSKIHFWLDCACCPSHLCLHTRTMVTWGSHTLPVLILTHLLCPSTRARARACYLGFRFPFSH